MANNLFNTYITRFGSAVRDEIDDATVLRMKSFLVAEQVGSAVGDSHDCLSCLLNRPNRMLFSMLRRLFIVFCNLIIMPHFWSRNNTMLCVELSIKPIYKIVSIAGRLTSFNRIGVFLQWT